MSSVSQIVKVVLVGVCLFLKTNIEISFLTISILQKQDCPLYDIPDEKRDI